MNQVLTRYNIKISDLAITIGLTIGLILISQFKVYITFIPLTFQTMYVVFIALINPPKRAISSTVLYALLAAIGFPVLAGLQSISQYNIASFGFVLGFIVIALVIGLLRDKVKSLTLVMVANVAVYVCGILWITLLGIHVSFIVLVPYIVFDIIKMEIAVKSYDLVKKK